MQQLSLDLQLKDDDDPYQKDDFLLLDENSSAYNFLEKFFKQTSFVRSQFTSFILKGDYKSGKTHLFHIFAKETGAEFLQSDNLGIHNLSHIFEANKFYILEDIEEIDEDLLFHIINAANSAKAFLLMSMKTGTEFDLKDLASRIKNIFTTEIRNPSYKSMRMLLLNAFSRRQLIIPNRIIDAINNHIDSTYESVIDAIRLVEFFREEKGKNITVKEVKKIFSK